MNKSNGKGTALTLMDKIANLPAIPKQYKGMLKHMGEKCIVFANTQKQADLMCKHSFHSKNKNSDEVLDKATWPKFFGLDESENYCKEFYN